MFKVINNRIKWFFFKRKALGKIHKGFSAHWTSFADEESIFDEYTRLGKNTRISKSSLGRCTYVVEGHIVNSDVGSFCSIAPQVRIGGFGGHPTQWLSTHPIFYSPLKQVGISFSEETKFEENKRTVIGNDVWVGTRAIVLDGVHVGDGAVIAAGAVVVKDVQPYSIVGGVPAKEIKKRFDDDVIIGLERLKWWKLELDLLSNLSEDFTRKTTWTARDIKRIEAHVDELYKKDLKVHGNLTGDEK